VGHRVSTRRTGRGRGEGPRGRKRREGRGRAGCGVLARGLQTAGARRTRRPWEQTTPEGGRRPKRGEGSSPIHDVSPARVGVTGGMYSDSNWRSAWRGNVTTAGRPESPGGHPTIGTSRYMKAQTLRCSSLLSMISSLYLPDPPSHILCAAFKITALCLPRLHSWPLLVSQTHLPHVRPFSPHRIQILRVTSRAQQKMPMTLVSRPWLKLYLTPP
jgi:hypothetical protein